MQGYLPWVSSTTWVNSLQYLEISSSQLVTEVVADDWTLQKLQYLDLHNNSLTGDYSQVIITGSLLWYLDLSNNQLTGDISNIRPGAQANMSYLKLNNNPGITGQLVQGMLSVSLHCFFPLLCTQHHRKVYQLCT